MLRSSVSISASLLAADFSRLAEQIAEAAAAGVHELHLDVMDNHFVPNLTFGPPVIAALRPHTSLPFDVHLMVENPDTLVPNCEKAGVQCVTVHAEASPHLHRTIQNIRQHGMAAGVALNPATPLAAIEEIACDLDRVLIMTVNPGFGGQEYIAGSAARVSRCRDLLFSRGSSARISVDGGIDAGTAAEVTAAGARILVAGSALFQSPGGLQAAVEQLGRAAALGCGERAVA